MIIDCISDLHGFYPQLEGGDLLIVAGDLTARDLPEERLRFLEWLADQKYRKKIWIAGNHDNSLVNMKFKKLKEDSVEYLCDSGTEFIEYNEYDPPVKGDFYTKTYKIWGSPWTSTFEGMNPHCKAFTKDTDQQLAEKWALIPEDTEILVTHSPPKGIMDLVERDDVSYENTGSLSLLRRARQLPNLKLFVFGHIHQGYGILTPQEMMNTAKERPDVPPTCKSVPYIVNASHVNEYYEPVNKPIRIEL
jgi:3',5'-cyclic AMP phosphodiesterase CpdA